MQVGTNPINQIAMGSNKELPQPKSFVKDIKETHSNISNPISKSSGRTRQLKTLNSFTSKTEQFKVTEPLFRMSAQAASSSSARFAKSSRERNSNDTAQQVNERTFGNNAQS